MVLVSSPDTNMIHFIVATIQVMLFPFLCCPTVGDWILKMDGERY